MTDDRQERIRRRAYALWQKEGEQHGSHEDHWHRAAAEIDLEDEEGNGVAARISEAAAATSIPLTSGSSPEAINPMPDPFSPRRTKGPETRPKDAPIAGAGNPSR